MRQSTTFMFDEDNFAKNAEKLAENMHDTLLLTNFFADKTTV